MALRPNGPRLPPKLDMSFADPSVPASDYPLNRTSSQPESYGNRPLPVPKSVSHSSSSTSQAAFASLFLEESSQWTGQSLIVQNPVPHRKPGGTSASSKHIHDWTDGRHHTFEMGTENNGTTIHPDATYSSEFRPFVPDTDRRPSITISSSDIQRSRDISSSLDSVKNIEKVIKNYAGDFPNAPHGMFSSSESSPGMSKSSPHSANSHPAGTHNHSIHPASPAQKKDFSDEAFDNIIRLGEGAGGAVHKVTDRRDGATYARKTITTRDANSIRQVMRELNIITAARHRNIVFCYGVYMSPSSSEVKIVMEYCDGKSLESVGEKLKEVGAIMGERPAGRIAEGILQGLAYLHTRRILHRDIKPSNILLSREGVVKLCDFGVSGELIHSNVGTFTGTLLYMAPERASGCPYNVRSDVWSTGISLLELVQNRFPFPRDLPPMEVVLMIRTGEPPRLTDDPDAQISWPPDMKDFIRQALIRDGNARPTPQEMLEHPWIIRVMRDEVNMARWIRQVWGWAKTPRERRSDITDLNAGHHYHYNRRKI